MRLKDGMHKLRLDMQVQNGSWYWEEYDTFIVQDNSTYYYMVANGVVGNTGVNGSMYHQSNSYFSTFDLDPSDSDCAPAFLSGWWYSNCFDTCLNCNQLPMFDSLFYEISTPQLFMAYLQSVSMQLICNTGAAY